MPTTRPAISHRAHLRDAGIFRSWLIRQQWAAEARRGGRTRVTIARVKAPLRAGREAYRAIRTYGAHAAAASGVAPHRQFARCWWGNLSANLSPKNFYWYGAYTNEIWRDARLYAQNTEAGVAYRAAARYLDTRAFARIASKREFAIWCEQEGIPCGQTVAAYTGGERTDPPAGAALFPPEAMFVKWAARFGGDDTLRIDWHDGAYHGSDGVVRTATELDAVLRQRSQDGPLIVQRLVQNHAALRNFGRALNTVRVMTIREGTMPSSVLIAVMRMGTGTSTADNVAQGGLATNVDLETGTIDVALRVGETGIPIPMHEHPDTGAAIPGVRLPDWTAALDLARRAHDRLGTLPCVGWDVVLSDRGPLLLEGNWNPCVKLPQMAARLPLLATPFAGTMVRTVGPVIDNLTDDELTTLLQGRLEHFLPH